MREKLNVISQMITIYKNYTNKKKHSLKLHAGERM